MDSPEFPTGNPSPSPSPRKKLQLQGPRPTTLKVHKYSYKIKRPPPQPSQLLPPPPPQPSQLLPPPPPQPPRREPVIIYTVSPKVIHTTTSDFSTLVQRLTGLDSSSSNVVDDSTGNSDLVSPAARLAMIEKANHSSPSEGEKKKSRKGREDDVDVVEGTVERFPGILSPLPSSVPPIISPNFFSPTVTDPNSLGFLLQQQDLSPIFQGNRNYIEGTLVPSPTTFLSSAPLTSPSPYLDLFNPFNF